MAYISDESCAILTYINGYFRTESWVRWDVDDDWGGKAHISLSRGFSIWFRFMCEIAHTIASCTFIFLLKHILSLHIYASFAISIEVNFFLSNGSIWFYVQIEMFYILCHSLGFIWQCKNIRAHTHTNFSLFAILKICWWGNRGKLFLT